MEHGGALGAEARKFFKLAQSEVSNRLSDRELEKAGWQVSSFCDYYHRPLLAAKLKGMGNPAYAAEAAAGLDAVLIKRCAPPGMR